MHASSVRIVEAIKLAHFDMAAGLFEEYAGGLGVDLGFQGFAAELSQLTVMYGPPGCLLLGLRESAPVACGALRSLGEGVCEIKRLYVRPAEQGSGLGRRLAERLIVRARDRGFATMRLDTLATMQAAQRMYRSLGFREVGAYYDNPLPGAIYLELDLRTVELGLRSAPLEP